MVPRKNSAESRLSRRLGEAFELWRRWLSRHAHAVDTARRSGRTHPRDETPTAAAPARSGLTRPVAATPVVLAAIAALAIGGVGRLALATGGAPRFEALLAVTFSTTIAVVRLWLLAYRLRRDALAAPVAVDAWARGTLAWAIAVDPALSAVAWALSAYVTWRALAVAGVPAPTARAGVMLAWGVHAAAVVVAWLTANAWVALIAG